MCKNMNQCLFPALSPDETLRISGELLECRETTKYMRILCLEYRLKKLFHIERLEAWQKGPLDGLLDVLTLCTSSKISKG